MAHNSPGRAVPILRASKEGKTGSSCGLEFRMTISPEIICGSLQCGSLVIPADTRLHRSSAIARIIPVDSGCREPLSGGGKRSRNGTFRPVKQDLPEIEAIQCLR